MRIGAGSIRRFSAISMNEYRNIIVPPVDAEMTSSVIGCDIAGEQDRAPQAHHPPDEPEVGAALGDARNVRRLQDVGGEAAGVIDDAHRRSEQRKRADGKEQHAEPRPHRPLELLCLDPQERDVVRQVRLTEHGRVREQRRQARW